MNLGCQLFRIRLCNKFFLISVFPMNPPRIPPSRINHASYPSSSPVPHLTLTWVFLYLSYLSSLPLGWELLEGKSWCGSQDLAQKSTHNRMRIEVQLASKHAGWASLGIWCIGQIQKGKWKEVECRPTGCPQSNGQKKRALLLKCPWFQNERKIHWLFYRYLWSTFQI